MCDFRSKDTFVLTVDGGNGSVTKDTFVLTVDGGNGSVTIV